VAVILVGPWPGQQLSQQLPGTALLMRSLSNEHKAGAGANTVAGTALCLYGYCH
jgi:hypothetical protein